MVPAGNALGVLNRKFNFASSFPGGIIYK